MVRRRPPAAATALGVAMLLPVLGGCFMVGPDYVRPQAPVNAEWPQEPGMQPVQVSYAEWWKVFGDPVLDRLIETAYAQNPTLQTAGARVMAAVARRGVAIGSLFPQQQDAFGGYTRVETSTNLANNVPDPNYGQFQLGFDAFWEVDVWGRLRRNVQAADAEVLASVASYDDVLVTLVAEVATNYIALRTFEERLAVALENIEVQRGGLGIAEERYEYGADTKLDTAQAAALLEDTRALVPTLEAQIRQSKNNLAILLGMPPRTIDDMLGGKGGIPVPPATIAIGVPADLLRRRPDIRLAERTLAAQSERIGVAKADLLPQLSLTGTIQLSAENAGDVFKGDSFEAFGGPQFRWAILNYGRITNNIRVQDAEYQALVGVYEDTVLRAQGEVENAIAAFFGARRRAESLARSVRWSGDAVDIAVAQYGEGAVDYTRVLNSQESLVTSQDRLADSRGDIALSLTALYKALGGGWEIRDGRPFISEKTAADMRARTCWGELLEDERQAAQARADEDADWRWWKRRKAKAGTAVSHDETASQPGEAQR